VGERMAVDEGKKDINDRWKGCGRGRRNETFTCTKKLQAKEYGVLRLKIDSLLQS
jgi:hypothetical protein